MKKYLSLLVALLLVFSFAGCDKKSDTDTDVEKHDELIEELHSDESKLVYDNGGLYKVVFYFEGDNVVGAEHVYTFDSEDEAKKEYEEKLELVAALDNIESVSLNGNYVIYTLAASQYEGLTKSSIRENYSYLTEVVE